MTMRSFRFPAPLGALLSRLPTLPPSFVFTRVLNRLLGPSLHDGSWQELRGKRIAIRVSDAGLQLHFTLGRKGFQPDRPVAKPDLALTATLRDFYLLAARKEDPDSLFFSRRLVVEGDTELGVMAKNLLDGQELPALTPALLAPPGLLALWPRRPAARP